jgi:hypothetical protein
MSLQVISFLAQIYSRIESLVVSAKAFEFFSTWFGVGSYFSGSDAIREYCHIVPGVSPVRVFQ